MDKKKELEKVQTEIAKNEEKVRSDALAQAKEEQSKKELTELEKQELANKNTARQKTVDDLAELKARETNLIADINNYGILLQGKVSSAKETEEQITKDLAAEVEKRNAILSENTGKATEEQAGQQTAVTAEQTAAQTEILKGQTEEQNTITQGQTEFRTGQWDYQTKYYGQQSEQQTKESNKENKNQSDYLAAQLKYRCSQFASAVNQMLSQVHSFAASVRSAAYQCGQDFYNGISSTEDDIRRYINKMARELREALQDAMNYDGSSSGDVDGSHRNGLSYVPFDNYNAILHKGERVLTASENKAYNEGISGSEKNVVINNTQNFYGQQVNERRMQRQSIRELKKLALGVN